MDPISYGVAAKQKQRIEKVIAEPDSTSGVITVPQVIATGETITVPAGRVAVLPNVQVDGVLNVEGEVFIPSGSGLSTVVQKSGDTMTGNLNFASGAKITGDFSNATPSSRTALQTNVANGYSMLDIVPNGTSTVSGFGCYSSSDVNNSSCFMMYIGNGGTIAKLLPTKTGTGAYIPITFFTSDLERMRIDTAGNVGIGTSSPFSSGGKSLHIYNSLNDGTPASNTSLYMESMNRNAVIFLKGVLCSLQFVDAAGITNGSLVFDHTNKTFTMVSPAGLGYGTGAGGTVTQLTSKSTAVTLNKPTGQIAMNNAALAAGASVEFQFNNNLISTADSLYITFVGSPSNNYSYKAKVNTGVAYIVIKNESAVSLSETVQLNFILIKGAIA